MFIFFKQKTAYEMRISDWSSDVCSSYLHPVDQRRFAGIGPPDDRELEGRVGILRVVVFGLDRLAVEMRQQRLAQIAHPLALFGRHLPRTAQPERHPPRASALPPPPLGLVCHATHPRGPHPPPQCHPTP